jgi:hypothetical protein
VTGYSYLNRTGFSWREGGAFPTAHVSWCRPTYRLYVYVALSPRRKFVWLWK